MNKSLLLVNKLAFIGTLLALCVVVLGAYVRLSDAGLGCPDWPGCYGELTVPQSESAIALAQHAFPNQVIHHGKAWKEMVHRYFAGTLGLITLALFVSAWIEKRNIKVNMAMPSFLLCLIVFQALLGMWTVTLLLKPLIVSAHLLGGMTTLAIFTWIAHRQLGSSSSSIIKCNRLRFLIRFAIFILFAQIILGGWTSTNYAALACTDFPTCHGAWIPNTDFSNAFHLIRNLGQNANGGALSLEALSTIQWTHRLGALVTFIYLGVLSLFILKYSQLKKIGILLLFLLVVQVSLGIANLILQLPLVLAVAHNLGAALLLVTLVILNSKISGHQSNYFSD